MIRRLLLWLGGRWWEEGVGCHDCGLPYGEEYGFPDFVVPHDIWNNEISPGRNEGGLLCPSCMCRRAYSQGLRNVPSTFRTGPFAIPGKSDA